MSDLKARLLKERLGEKTIDIPGVGEIRIRGLSRVEVLLMSKSGSSGAALEQKVLALGMVDPELTEKEVALWQKSASSGELDRIVDEINALSGLGQGAQKSQVSGPAEQS